jgi:poly(3-hydroxybutyrate) depolymerase
MKTFWQVTVYIIFLIFSRDIYAVGSCGQGGEKGQGEVKFEDSLYLYFVPDTYDSSKPFPLLINFHGDRAEPSREFLEIPDGWSSAFKYKEFIGIAPRAPTVFQGVRTWWQNRTNWDNNMKWMDRLLEHLLKLYNIDLDRIYTAGFSGGCKFQVRYVMERQHIFAAALWNSCGGFEATPVSPKDPYVPPKDPNCKIPIRMVYGAEDPLGPVKKGVENSRKVLEENGHEVEVREVPGLKHDYHKEMYLPGWQWLKSRFLCGNPRPDGCICETDTDCKGDEICKDQVCQDKNPNPPSPQEKEPILTGGCYLFPQQNQEPLSILIMLIALVGYSKVSRKS